MVIFVLVFIQSVAGIYFYISATVSFYEEQPDRAMIFLIAGSVMWISVDQKIDHHFETASLKEILTNQYSNAACSDE